MNNLKRVYDLSKQFGVGFTIKYVYYYKTRQYEKYIDFVLNYLKNFLTDEIRHCNETFSENVTSTSESPTNVFVCWWQGYDNMPALCKQCYKRLKSVLSEKYKLILITNENYKVYADIPEEIMNKLELGKIPVTQFSDILRQALIYQNGGIWIDATVWTNPGVNDYFEMIDDFWSVRLEKIYNPIVHGQVISSCRWGSFILGGKKGSPIFRFVFECMCKYYNTHDVLIDYFLQNFLIRLAVDETKQGKKAIDNLKPSNPHLYHLKTNLGEAYNQTLFDSFNADTSFFKLTYKTDYPLEKNGKPTFYNYIMANGNKEDCIL